MPDIYYQDDGSLRHVSDIYYQDGASLRTLTEVWYQDGATLRQVWSKSTALVHLENLSQSGRALQPAEAKASIILKTNGWVQGNANTNPYVNKFIWKLVGASSDYQVRATLLSGTPPAGSDLGSWIAMSSDVSWNLPSGLIIGETSCSLSIEIRDVATLSVQDSATFTLRATRDSGS